VWGGMIGKDGYLRFSLRRPDGRQRTVAPHQVAATIVQEELGPGVTLLHDCDVRICVRPAPSSPEWERWG